MNRTASLWAAGLAGALALSPALLRADATVGQPAPSFSAPDQTGTARSLDAYKGKWVVLEWVNPECPFVQKHYGSGNMQALQKRFTGQEVVWVTINSTATGHPEYLKPAQQSDWMAKQGGSPTYVALDADGKVGRAYGARTTPHMYVIDPAGKLAYAGAIDDKRSTNPADVKTANNYVAQAIGELKAGKPVSTPATPAYGCSIKYSDS